jgi:hypothetical protein
MRNAAMALGGALLILCACTSAPEPTPAPPPSSSPSPAPKPAPTSPRPAPARDQCGAADLQQLVGRSRTEVPVPVDPSRQRVACTTCPVTQDYSPTRLNFFFDAGTGRITEIRCG